MEVILIQDVDNLGAINEVVKVKNGYARNFLLPRQLAIENSHSNRKQLEERMKQCIILVIRSQKSTCLSLKFFQL